MKKRILSLLLCLIMLAGLLPFGAVNLTANAAAPTYTSQPEYIYYNTNDYNSATGNIRIYVGVNTDFSADSYTWYLRKDDYTDKTELTNLAVASDNLTGNSARLVADIPYAKAKSSNYHIYCMAKKGAYAKASNMMHFKSNTVTITKQPVTVNLYRSNYNEANDNFTVTDEITVSGSGLSYQWQFSMDGGKTWQNNNDRTATMSQTWSADNIYSGKTNLLRCIVIMNNTTLKVSATAEIVPNTIFTKTLPSTIVISNGYICWINSSAANPSVADLKCYSTNIEVTARGPANSKITYTWEYTSDSNTTRKSLPATTYSGNILKYVPCDIANLSGLKIYCYAYNETLHGNAVVYAPVSVKTVTASLKSISTLTSSNLSDGYYTFKASVSSTGLSSPKYDWQYKIGSGKWKSYLLTSDSSATYKFSAENVYAGLQVRCVVTSHNGTVEICTDSSQIIYEPVFLEALPSTVYATQKSDATYYYFINVPKVSVAASGKLTYKWECRRNTSASWSSCSSTTVYGPISLNKVFFPNGEIRCTVTDSTTGKSITTTAKLATITPITVTVPEKTQMSYSEKITSGTYTGYYATTIKVKAEGTNLKYQWYYRLSGETAWTKATDSSATTASWNHPFTASQCIKGIEYKCDVTVDGKYTVSSNTGFIGLCLQYTTEPKSTSAFAGDNVSFTVGFTDCYGKPTFQWQISDDGKTGWTNLSNTTTSTDKIEGATSSTLKIYKVTDKYIGKYFRLIGTAPMNTNISNVVSLTAKNIEITSQPKNVEAALGKTVSFKVTAKGSSALTYTWQMKQASAVQWSASVSAKNIGATGVNSDTLTLTYSNLSSYDYVYRCEVRDAKGNYVYSETVKVTKPAKVSVTGISVTPDSYNFSSKGVTKEITVKVLPIDATNQKVTWTSSNPDVAIVNAYGKLESIGNGYATLTCKTEDGGYTATINVTVAHTHEMQQVADDKFLKTPATCTSPAVYYVSCACGAKNSETFTSGKALGHNIVKVEAKAATETAEGNTEYYRCSRCGLIYKDAAGKTQITKAETVIPKLSSAFTPGDIDNDGKITAADARLALRASVGLTGDKDNDGKALNLKDTTSREFKAADVDPDSKITAADARLILRASVGLEDLSKKK